MDVRDEENRTLYDRFAYPVSKYICRYLPNKQDAEDLLVEVFLAAFNNKELLSFSIFSVDVSLPELPTTLHASSGLRLSLSVSRRMPESCVGFLNYPAASQESQKAPFAPVV